MTGPLRDPIEILAQHVVGVRWHDLPPRAVESAKIFLLDTIGVAVGGSAGPFADRLRDTARRWGAGEEATILGIGDRVPALTAALLNATQAHSQEFDPIHEGAVVHPLATILAAALALAERQGGVSGRDFILATVLGADVAVTIGMAARSRMRFFRPATAGIFGATAAAGRLAGLALPQLIDALGLASAQAAGTMQSHAEGKPSLALQIGMAARAAINAVDLAAAGFPGPRRVLEGEFGYFPLVEGQWDVAPGLAELGRRWRITELSHKPFPTGRATHAGIDGLQRLRQRHDIPAAAVRSVRLLAPPLVHQLVGRPWRAGAAASYARLSFPYVAALTLSRGTVTLQDFAPAALADPQLVALAEKVTVVIDGNSDPGALMPQAVQITLESGAVHEEPVLHAIGSPQNPLDAERRLAKFRACWQSGALPLDAARGEQMIAMIDALDAVPDVGAVPGLAC